MGKNGSAVQSRYLRGQSSQNLSFVAFNGVDSVNVEQAVRVHREQNTANVRLKFHVRTQRGQHKALVKVFRSKYDIRFYRIFWKI